MIVQPNPINQVQVHLVGPSFPNREYTHQSRCCSICRYVLENWVGWPSRITSGNRYPGDLILPCRKAGFPSSWTSCQGYLGHQRDLKRLQKERYMTTWPFSRNASELVPQDCLLCNSVWDALALGDDADEVLIQMQVLPLSSNDAALVFRRDNSSSKCFRLSLLSDDDKDNDFETRLSALTNSTGGHASISLLRDRLRSCCELRAPYRRPKWIPSRLLEIASNGISGYVDVRLALSHELPFTPDYLTLSHRWGNERPLALTRKSLASFNKSIPWDLIPKTFQEAIKLTSSLGHNYLWIDSLCIIQDDTSDWKVEAEQMCDVYSNTVLNIYAGNSDTSGKGLFSHTRNAATATGFVIRTDWPCMAPSRWFCQLNTSDLYNDRHATAAASCLASRGWVVQEELLPPAVAYFGQKDIFWFCRHGDASEIMPTSSHALNCDRYENDWSAYSTVLRIRKTIQEDWSKDNLRARDAFFRALRRPDTWGSLIERYSRCNLAFDIDRLTAISGLARRVADMYGWKEEDFLAGLWRNDLLETICWTSRTPFSARRYSTYIAPTWSWASLEGSVTTDMYPSLRRSALLAQLLDIDISKEAGFGAITSGSISVKSYLWEMSHVQHERQGVALEPRVVLQMACGYNFECYINGVDMVLDTKDCCPWTSGEHTTKYYFLARGIMSQKMIVRVPQREETKHFSLFIDGLLLQPTGHVNGEFKRVGTVVVPMCFLVHGFCSACKLSPACYLEKQIQPMGISETARTIFEGTVADDEEFTRGLRSVMSDTSLIFDSEDIQRYTEYVPEWKLKGRGYWPVTDLSIAADNPLFDTKYVVRVV